MGDEGHWNAVGLGGFVFAALAFAIAVIVAARRAALSRLAGGLALGGAGFVAAILVTCVTYRAPASGPRIGEIIVPITWGIAYGFYVFGALLLAAVLTARSKRPPTSEL